jgi:hemolysin activation/secretion protein
MNVPTVFTGCPPSNYGGSRSRPPKSPHQATLSTLCVVAIAAALCLSAIWPAFAQQASQPGYDPKQTEKHFDDVQEGPSHPARAPLHMPSFAHSQGAADGKSLFVLRGISLVGATAIPHEELAATYRPYIGRKVSQADLAGIASEISELYRKAGFHLSRAIIPSQDIADGHVRIQVIEGSITEFSLKGDGAEQFGVRPLLNVVLSETPSGWQRWSASFC